MRATFGLHSILSILVFVTVVLVCFAVAIVSLATPASAQTPSGTGSAGTVAVIGVMVVILAILGVAVKLYDVKRKHEAEAVHLQAQLSDALMREPGLLGMPITATVRMAPFKSAPPIVEVSGEVPTREARERAFNIVRAEAARLRPDARFEDLITVVRGMAEHRGA